jgi:DNA (cytosine-5)-methyltransferase 1
MISVIDLFAGPGGLGEGFAAYRSSKKQPYKLILSIEKDFYAHKTLRLRSFTRRLLKIGNKEIYEYFRSANPLVLNKLKKNYPSIWDAAEKEAVLHELNSKNKTKTENLIRSALKKDKNWVLLGGPPCQAYSLVGRARRTNENRIKFGKDKRHTLYKEYLHILHKFQPSVFIMENVKGILSAKHKGKMIFQNICRDLSRAGPGYSLYSLSGAAALDSQGQWQKDAFVIRAEQYGIPQKRHRVFILGVRNDIKRKPAFLNPNKNEVSLAMAIQGFSSIRSRLSSGDKFHKWLKCRNEGLKLAGLKIRDGICESSGAEFVAQKNNKRWFMADPHMDGILNHESRSHLAEDVMRYAFSAAYASKHGKSPTVFEFPKSLLPKHKNLTRKNVPFIDRFKVQVRNKPASTITSHISKDGHYYIHPDPAQARSLTVREAAKLQTFPDNYKFEGPRTEQYKQVGNAVPPLLAQKIAHVVAGLLERL